LQKVVEAFIVVLSVFELLYLLSLHAGVPGGDYGSGYNNTTGAGGVNMALVQGEKHHHGIPAASAV
jgi:hypothetical protein